MTEITEPVTMMDHFVSLTYTDLKSPPVVRYCDELMKGRMIGHKCPVCGLVYVPPRGYCPIDTIETTDEHEVELAQRGVVSAYTIVTPVQYYGQQETEPFAKATILLDPPGGTLALQDLVDCPLDQVRAGMRVEAVWVPEGERSVKGIGNRWGSADGCIEGFRPTGEPDMPPDAYEEHVF